MSLLILVVDDEPDVEALFRQQFRRDIRDGRFTMDFAQSAQRDRQPCGRRRSRGPLRVKTGKAQCEHMFSALPPKADK